MPSYRPLLAVAALLTAAPVFAAEPIKVESSIAAVTVYVDRAIVTRTATTELPEGTQEILFAGLPYSLNPDLLQVSGQGTAETTILDVRAVAAQLTVPANARLKALQEQLRGIQGEMRTLTDRAAVVTAQRDFLERIKAAATTPPGKEGAALPTVEQWQSLAVYYAEGMGKLSTQLQDIDREKEDVQARLAAVQREIAGLQPQSAKSVQDVYVRVDVTKAGSLELSLAYTVAEASWGPTYDVRVTAASKTLALSYAAMVRQSSGEDWHAVKLTLSTARPAVGGTPPELSPWFVGELQPQVFRESRKAAAPSAAMARAMGGAAEADAMVMSNFAVADVQGGLTAATFTVVHPSDIPADNAPHKVPVTTLSLDAELTHLAVPKLAELAYLRAAVKNTSSYPLIAGPVNMYVDGTFVARSTLKTVMPDEKFDLDLGVDDGVTVKRKLINRLKEDTGIVSRKQQITYTVAITVQNNRSNAITMEVKDQVPVSQHERITVELLAPPARDIKKVEDGTVTWNFELAPGAKRDLSLKIAIEHPTELPVAGLE